MPKQKILVCGATGFIGRNVAERLAAREDCEVIGTFLNPEGCRLPQLGCTLADLTDWRHINYLMREEFDMVIQCAAVTSGAKDIVARPYIHVTDNTVMNTLLLRAVFARNVPRFLFLSCSIMYPPNFGRPVTENDVDYSAIFPPYFGGAWMKLGVEKQCEFYSRFSRTRFTVVRHSNVYGPYDKFDLDHSHMFGATMTKVLTNTDGVLSVWGDGQEQRDLLYIDDLVDFIERAVVAPEKSAYEIYNVGSGAGVAVREVVEKIVAASGKQLRIEYDLAKPHIRVNIVLDPSKAQASFGWRAQTSLEMGIQQTMQWYKENL